MLAVLTENYLLVIVVLAGIVYLVCDWAQKAAAVQELARLVFATAALAMFLGGAIK